MKKISLYMILGILIGSLLTNFILNSKEPVVQEAPEVFNSSELENLKYTLNTKEEEIQNFRAQKMDLENKNLELLKITQKKLLSFSNDELGFSFSYPAWFGKLSFDIVEGEIGKMFYGSFENVALEFGGTTKDFSAGRGGWPTDYNGNAAYPEKVLKTFPIQGGTVTLLRGEGNPEPGNWFSEGTFGAFINLNGKNFNGLAFQAGETYHHRNDDKKITLDEFESVLKTLVIK